MNIDTVSILLAVISIMLAICSILQAMGYKKLGDKLEEDKKQIIKAIHDNSVYSAITIRHLDEDLYSSPNTVNLHKDELYVYKNRNYKPYNVAEVIEKLNRELPIILKQTYIDSILEALNLDDGSSTEVDIVTLKYQYDKDDLNKIKKLNEIFYEDGISFEIKIS